MDGGTDRWRQGEGAVVGHWSRRPSRRRLSHMGFTERRRRESDLENDERRCDRPSRAGNGFPRKARTLRVDVTAFQFARVGECSRRSRKSGSLLQRGVWIHCSHRRFSRLSDFFYFYLNVTETRVKSFFALSPKYGFATYLRVVNLRLAQSTVAVSELF